MSVVDKCAWCGAKLDASLRLSLADMGIYVCDLKCQRELVAGLIAAAKKAGKP